MVADVLLNFLPDIQTAAAVLLVLLPVFIP